MIVIRKPHEAEVMKTRGGFCKSTKDLPNRQAAMNTDRKVLLDCMIGVSLSLKSWKLSSLSSFGCNEKHGCRFGWEDRSVELFL